MTTYYVKPNGDNSKDGKSEANAWATFSHAAANSSAGDTIKVMPGTYQETLTITKNNQIWEGSAGAGNSANWPVIDGKYGPNLIYFGNNGIPVLPHPRKAPGVLPTPSSEGVLNDGLVTIRPGVTGVTLRYLKIYNSAQYAIRVAPGCDDTTITNCHIDFSYRRSIHSPGTGSNGPYIYRLQILNNVITRSSIRKLAVGKTRFCECHQPNGEVCSGPIDKHDGNFEPCGGKDSVDVAIAPQYTFDALVKGNVLAFAYGEGISCDTQSDRMTIEDNIVHNTYHWALGVNNTQNSIIRRNIVFTDGTLPVIGSASSAIAMGDELVENSKTNNFYSKNVKIYNNLCVGFNKTIWIRSGCYVSQFENTYVGYNTFVGTPQTERVFLFKQGAKRIDETKKKICTNNVTPAPHKSLLIENNLFVRNGAQSIGSCDAQMGNTVFRNNAFSETQATINNVAKLMAQGASNVYSTTVANPGGPRGAGGYEADMSNDACIALAVNQAFDKANYYLGAGSACIGAGANHLVPAGMSPSVTPAVGPNAGQDNTDGVGNTRSGTRYDIGFHEFDGSAPTVTPNFTQKDSNGNNVTSGTTPITVTFTDTSTLNGATVSNRRWDFNGDGVYDLVNAGGTVATFQYTTPGNYRPSMQLVTSSGTYTKLGTTMTFTGTGDPPRPEGAVVIDTVSKAIGTSTGTVDFDFTLNNRVPKLVVFTMTATTDTSVVADHALLCHGFASFRANTVNQFCAAVWSEDDVTPTASGRQQRSDAVLIAVDKTGAITGQANIAANGFSTNRVRLTISDAFPASYIVTATAYAGAGFEAIVGTGRGPAGELSPASLPIGFPPDLLCVVSANRALSATGLSASMSIGYATSAENQMFVRWVDPNNVTPSAVELNAGNNGIAYRATSNAQIVMRVQSLGSATSLVAEGGSFEVDFGWYALRMATKLDLRIVASPSATGNQDIALGWQPGHLQGITTLLTAPGTGVRNWRVNDTTSAASHIGMYVMQGAVNTGAIERTSAPGVRHGTTISTTHTTSRIMSGLQARRSYTEGTNTQSNSPLVAAASFLSTGYRLAWSTITTGFNNRAQIIVAMQTTGGTTPVGPTVSFQVRGADGGEARGVAPLTVFLTDSSDGNGASITSWEIDWGDGSIETVNTRPNALEHVYLESGNYTIKVTATNTNGTGTSTLNDAVVVVGRPTDQIIGPLRPATITEDTTNEVILDIDNPERGLITHRLDLGALKLLADYTLGQGRQLTVDGNRWQLAIIDNQLVIMTNTGVTGKIDITWDAGGPVDPPPTGSGTVDVKIATGNDDGRELGDGTVQLGNTSLIDLDAANISVALRFRNITIPAGATIQSAKLTIRTVRTDADNASMDIYAHKVANSPDLSADANGISTLFNTKTTASVGWRANDIGFGFRDSPDLSAVIQEVINVSGWASGNAITLLLDPDASSNLEIRPYEFATTGAPGDFAAQLVIEWTL